MISYNIAFIWWADGDPRLCAHDGFLIFAEYGNLDNMLYNS